MGISFRILALGGTEPEIHLGGHLPPPIATYVLKNTIATLGLKINLTVYTRERTRLFRARQNTS